MSRKGSRRVMLTYNLITMGRGLDLLYKRVRKDGPVSGIRSAAIKFARYKSVDSKKGLLYLRTIFGMENV
jgi:hypothetical protein